MAFKKIIYCLNCWLDRRAGFFKAVFAQSITKIISPAVDLIDCCIPYMVAGIVTLPPNIGLYPAPIASTGIVRLVFE